MLGLNGMKIAIQGVEASFHDIAARQFFGDDTAIVPCETFAETFQALAAGRATRAVVAIENSLFGSINEVYDLLLKYKFWISGEVYLRVEQCLIGLPGTQLAKVKEVHSHPVALAQCEEFLDTRLAHAERFEHHDTAASVIDIKKWGDPTKVAIASAQAATRQGLAILAHEIETNQQNYTRFVVLQPHRHNLLNANKTSLILVTDHKPGALYNALGAFAERDLNLTKLQSRPIIGQAWHYMFYVDVAADLSTKAFEQALAALQQQHCEVTILGSYKEGARNLQP